MHYGCVEHTYTLERSGHSVRVKVIVEPLTQRSVNVSPNAFSWLGAQGGSETNEEYHQAASSGAMSALSDADAGGAVTILEVHYAPAHTTLDDVREATFIAVRRALSR